MKFIYYVIFINTLTFFSYKIDKQLSIRRKYRISEKLLFLLSFLGGCFGSIAGMYFFHHKTKKTKFIIVNLVLLVVYVLLIISLFI